MKTRVIDFPYRDRREMDFTVRDVIRITALIKPFIEKIQASNTYDLEMYLVHDKLVFGMDLFTLGQLDPLSFATIDTFPLNVQ